MMCSSTNAITGRYPGGVGSAMDWWAGPGTSAGWPQYRPREDGCDGQAVTAGLDEGILHLALQNALRDLGGGQGAQTAETPVVPPQAAARGDLGAGTGSVGQVMNLVRGLP